jgi:hypothetical protein
LIDRIHNDAVFTAFEALKLGCRLSTVCAVHKPSVGVDVDRACRLSRPDIVRPRGSAKTAEWRLEAAKTG